MYSYLRLSQSYNFILMKKNILKSLIESFQKVLLKMIKLTLTNFNSVLYCTNWLAGSFTKFSDCLSLHFNTRIKCGWKIMDSWYFSLVLCFERFFRKNQQIFPLLLVKYLSFREGRRCREKLAESIALRTWGTPLILLMKWPPSA